MGSASFGRNDLGYRSNILEVLITFDSLRHCMDGSISSQNWLVKKMFVYRLKQGPL